MKKLCVVFLATIMLVAPVVYATNVNETNIQIGTNQNNTNTNQITEVSTNTNTNPNTTTNTNTTTTNDTTSNTNSNNSSSGGSNTLKLINGTLNSMDPNKSESGLAEQTQAVVSPIMASIVRWFFIALPLWLTFQTFLDLFCLFFKPARNVLAGEELNGGSSGASGSMGMSGNHQGRSRKYGLLSSDFYNTVNTCEGGGRGGMSPGPTGASSQNQGEMATNPFSYYLGRRTKTFIVSLFTSIFLLTPFGLQMITWVLGLLISGGSKIFSSLQGSVAF